MEPGHKRRAGKDGPPVRLAVAAENAAQSSSGPTCHLTAAQPPPLGPEEDERLEGDPKHWPTAP